MRLSRPPFRSGFVLCGSGLQAATLEKPSPSLLSGTCLGCDLYHFWSVRNTQGAFHLSVTRVAVSLLLMVCFYICTGYFERGCSDGRSSRSGVGGEHSPTASGGEGTLQQVGESQPLPVTWLVN